MKITIDRETVRHLRAYLDALWGEESNIPGDGRESRTYATLFPQPSRPLTWRQEKRRALREMLALQGVIS